MPRYRVHADMSFLKELHIPSTLEGDQDGHRAQESIRKDNKSSGTQMYPQCVMLHGNGQHLLHVQTHTGGIKTSSNY
jgi:hypothetical protein